MTKFTAVSVGLFLSRSTFWTIKLLQKSYTLIRNVCMDRGIVTGSRAHVVSWFDCDKPHNLLLGEEAGFVSYDRNLWCYRLLDSECCQCFVCSLLRRRGSLCSAAAALHWERPVVVLQTESDNSPALWKCFSMTDERLQDLCADILMGLRPTADLRGPGGAQGNCLRL